MLRGLWVRLNWFLSGYQEFLHIEFGTMTLKNGAVYNTCVIAAIATLCTWSSGCNDLSEGVVIFRIMLNQLT